MNRHAVSKIGTFNLIDNSNSSYVQFGDHSLINSKNRGIAILQTQNKTTANAGEPMFDQYAIFNPLYKQNELVYFPPIHVNVNKPLYLCELPDIPAEKQIKHISIVISSNSSTILIGNGKRHYAENRQKNIRQHLG